MPGFCTNAVSRPTKKMKSEEFPLEIFISAFNSMCNEKNELTEATLFDQSLRPSGKLKMQIAELDVGETWGVLPLFFFYGFELKNLWIWKHLILKFNKNHIANNFHWIWLIFAIPPNVKTVVKKDPCQKKGKKKKTNWLYSLSFE